MIAQPANSKRSGRIGFFIVALAFIAVTILTWRKWADLVIDFGPQLYVPWRLSEGDVFNRDLMYSYGPLSQIYHAFLFKIFSPSFLVIIFSNLAITAGMITLIYRRFLAESDALTATMIGLAIILVFAFGHYLVTGSYNYPAPYSHESLHCLALSVLIVVLWSDWVKHGRMRDSALAGFCFGLIFMAKPEFITALLPCGLVALIFFYDKSRVASLVKSLIAFFAAAILPVIGLFLYFLRVENAAVSWNAVCFAWVPVFKKSVVKIPFFQWCMGLDTPGYHLKIMLLQFFCLAALLGLYAAIFRRNKSWMTATPLVVLTAFLDWKQCGYVLPLITLVLLGLLFKTKPIPVFPILWSVFGLGLLARLGLFSRIWHYGFVLDMPVFVSAVYFLVWLLPERLKAPNFNYPAFRGTVVMVLLVAFASLSWQSWQLYRDKTVAVGQGSDLLYGFNRRQYPVAPAMAEALFWMEKYMPPKATLDVLPEGVLVNYLSRRVNSTHYFRWSPSDMALFDADTMFKDFREHSPDYVMLLHRTSKEYDLKYFGQQKEYGQELVQYIREHYDVVHQIGAVPLQDERFGLQILKRKTDDREK